MSESESTRPRRRSRREPETTRATTRSPRRRRRAAVAGVVPRWVQLVALPLVVLGALRRAARAGGRSCCCSSSPALIALILNPFVAPAAPRALPARLAVARGVPRLRRPCSALRLPAGQPGRRPGLDVPERRAEHRRRREQPRSPTSRTDSTATASTSRSRSRARPRCRRSARRSSRGPSEHRLLRRDAAQTARRGAASALILVIVLSVYMLLYGERIGAAVRAGGAAGDGTPEDDYPTRVQARGARLRARPAAVQLVMGTSAGRRRCGSSARSGSSPTARRTRWPSASFYGFDGADPVRRARPRRAPAGAGRAVHATRSTRCGWRSLFTALQQIEGHIVAPNVFGQALRINPLLVIFALLLGGAALRDHRRAHRAADRGDRCARRSSTCAATSCSSRGARRAATGARRCAGRRSRGAPRARSAARPGAEDDAYCRALRRRRWAPAPTYRPAS